jgi:protein SCO1/2
MKKTLVALAIVGLVATGCRMLDSRARALDGLRGVKLSPARAKPAYTLEDTHGLPFDFVKATAHKTTLLYFGYTNCPDVCPAHMSNIAGALKALSPEQRAQVRVVFVTTDPARDTPERLRGWLNNFDTSFVGLRGPIDEVNRIQASLGLPAAVMEAMPGMAPGPRVMNYGVGHAAQVLAFTPDDSLRIEYPSGFTRDDWANDLPKLIKIISTTP